MGAIKIVDCRANVKTVLRSGIPEQSEERKSKTETILGAADQFQLRMGLTHVVSVTSSMAFLPKSLLAF